MGARLDLSSKIVVAGTLARDALRHAFTGRQPQLSLITDFGSGDEAVYAVKSAARAIYGRARIEDICHNVPLGNVLIGAARLRRTVTLPTEREGTVYVAVVDPGVGTSRKNIILETQRGKFLVGPDNGVLSLASEAEGIARVVEIQNPDLTLLHLAQSKTFHGKDVFAPAAAWLLKGVPLLEFGRELDPADLVRIKISAESSNRKRVGYIIDHDGCGAVRTTVPNHLPESVIGRVVNFSVADNTGLLRFDGRARLVRTFAEAGEREAVLVLSSTGNLDLAANLGDVVEQFGIDTRAIALGEGLRPRLRIEVDIPVSN